MITSSTNFMMPSRSVGKRKAPNGAFDWPRLPFMPPVGYSTDTHILAIERSLDLKHHMTLGFGEQGVVLATADILARMEFGAALPDDDVAGQRQLATKQLDAEALD
jgi:hypothetical protein